MTLYLSAPVLLLILLTTTEENEEEISKLNINKASGQNNIPFKLLKRVGINIKHVNPILNNQLDSIRLRQF